MQLLGRYLDAGGTADAEALVEQMRLADASGPGTANAVLRLGLHYLSTDNTDKARACFDEVARRHEALTGR
jgi:hypothetical protein